MTALAHPCHDYATGHFSQQLHSTNEAVVQSGCQAAKGIGFKGENTPGGVNHAHGINLSDHGTLLQLTQGPSPNGNKLRKVNGF